MIKNDQKKGRKKPLRYFFLFLTYDSEKLFRTFTSATFLQNYIYIFMRASYFYYARINKALYFFFDDINVHG